MQLRPRPVPPPSAYRPQWKNMPSAPTQARRGQQQSIGQDMQRQQAIEQEMRRKAAEETLMGPPGRQRQFPPQRPKLTRTRSPTREELIAMLTTPPPIRDDNYF